MKKTLDSQIKAVRKYEKEREVFRIVLPKGTKEKITSYGYTYNAFVNEAVARMLKSLENGSETTEKKEIISAESVPETNVKEKKITIQQLQEMLNEKSENNRIMKEETARKKKQARKKRKNGIKNTWKKSGKKRMEKMFQLTKKKNLPDAPRLPRQTLKTRCKREEK